MKQNWFKICNAVEADDEAEILIYDVIGEFGSTAKNFVEEIKSSKAKRLHVRINSPGGSVFDGLTIYNYLRGHNARVTVDGIAASAASIVAMAGKTVTMATGALMMIHNPWGVTLGNSEEHREAASVLEKIEGSIVQAYVSRTKQSAAQIQEWMDEEKWMDGAEAIALGFADSVDTRVETQNFAVFNLGKYKHPPVKVDNSGICGMENKTFAKFEDATAEVTRLIEINGTLTEQAAAANTAKTTAETALADLKKAHGAALEVNVRIKGELEAVKSDLVTAKALNDTFEARVKSAAAIEAMRITNDTGTDAVAAATTAGAQNEYEQYQAEKDPFTKAQLWQKHKAKIQAQGKLALAKGK